MSDFWQHGPITTLHRLPHGAGIDPEGEILGHCAERPAALLIPALASEMDGPAWPLIMDELKGAPYLDEVVLALGGATAPDLDRARRALAALPVRGTVVWPGSPGLGRVLEESGSGIDVGPPGKGRDVWIALGYLSGREGLHCVALHDADIVTYERGIPMRLLAPLVHPRLEMAFCKGYYARISGGGFAGRVTRLLVVPLVSVLSGEAFTPALRTIGAMRYALAGEFSMTMELANQIPVPRDWGLEVGILSAVSRAVPFERICQADLCDNYEHKHQDLHPEDAGKGLNRMAVEVSAALLRQLDRPPADLAEKYRERAMSMIPRYRADALVNGLEYDETGEAEAVRTFTAAVSKAAGLSGEDLPEPLPSWAETEKLVPGLRDAIVAAVNGDNR